MALFAQKRFLPLVIDDSLLAAVGLGGIALPQLFAPARASEKVPWWVHVIGGIVAVAELALGFYLWLMIYRGVTGKSIEPAHPLRDVIAQRQAQDRLQ